jgi:predicted RNA-binding protein
MGKAERRRIGTLGREHIMEDYNFVELQNKWVEVIDKVLENKEDYNGIRFKEIA